MRTNYIYSVFAFIVLSLCAQASFAAQTIGCGGIYNGFNVELDPMGFPVKAIVSSGYSTYRLDDCQSPRQNVFVCKSSVQWSQPRMVETRQVSVTMNGPRGVGVFTQSYQPDVYNISAKTQFNDCK